MGGINWVAVGSVGNWAMVFLTLLTLLKLRQYVADTRNLAKTSAAQAALAEQQIESANRPVIAIGEHDGDTWIRNVGSGTAVNVEWDLPAHEGQPAGVERRSFLTLDSQAVFIADRADTMAHFKDYLSVRYSSISGKRYETVGEWRRDADNERALVQRFRVLE